MLSAFQRLSAFALMLLAAAWLWAADLAAIPPLTAPVLDSAQMMQPEARAELNAHLMQYSREKGSQIIVLTVPAIAPETPFDYAARAMQQYEPGRKEVSDGVLLLLVRDERKTHLAVGRGLEGAIPDVYAKRILDDVLRPYLQKGQTDAGIYAAVSQIEKLIAGEALPAPAAQTRSEGSGDGWMYETEYVITMVLGLWMVNVVFSLGHRLLNFQSARVTYFVNASLFIYLVHHPLTLLYGAWITPVIQSNTLGFITGLVFVVGIALVLYEIHLRIPLLRFLFSGKFQQKTAKPQISAS